MEKNQATCPHCNKSVELEMPNDRSVVMFDCPHCHTRVKALTGKCCVFCSYGEKHCPVCTCNDVGNQGFQDLPSNQQAGEE